MNLSQIDINYTCLNCGKVVNDVLRNCQVCGEDAGPPNVRACNFYSNKEAINEKLDAIISNHSDDEKKLNLIDNLFKYLKKNTRVIVSLKPSILRNIMHDPKSLYNNYEELVASGTRAPASMKDDALRNSIAGTIFGTYKKEIRYGAINIENKGLSSYGSAHCVLKIVSIKKRTTFMDENSYKFIKTHKIGHGGEIPLGHTCSWGYKERLALNKLSQYFMDYEEYEEILKKLLVSTKDRENDEFIEAHIYGSFNGESIESIHLDEDVKREERNDFEIAEQRFKELLN